MKLLKVIILFISLFPLNYTLTEEIEELIFCFVGDAGEVNPTQAKVVEALANSDCSIVWHLGDITQLGVQSLDDPELQDSFLTPFRPFLETGIPFYLTIAIIAWTFFTITVLTIPVYTIVTITITNRFGCWP